MPPSSTHGVDAAAFFPSPPVAPARHAAGPREQPGKKYVGRSPLLRLLAAEIGGRFNADSQRLVQRLVTLRARRAPAALRGVAAQGWARRWRGTLAVAIQRATCSTVFGVWTMPVLPNADGELPITEVLQLATDPAPSRLPLR